MQRLLKNGLFSHKVFKINLIEFKFPKFLEAINAMCASKNLGRQRIDYKYLLKPLQV